MKAKILMVAPSRPDLPDLAAEVQGVVNTEGLDVHLLQGEVRERDVGGGCCQGPWDVLWIASHGGREGIWLSAEVLDIDALVPYVVVSQVRLVFLNTCESVEIANQLSQEAGVDVICTLAQAPDRTAMRTGMLFARKLAQVADFRNAYEQSKPGRNRLYLYIAAYRGAGKMHDQQQSQPMLINGKQLEKLTLVVERMSETINQMRIDIELLKQTTLALKTLEGLTRRVQNQLDGLPPVALLWISAFFSLVAMLISAINLYLLLQHLTGV